MTIILYTSNEYFQYFFYFTMHVFFIKTCLKLLCMQIRPWKLYMETRLIFVPLYHLRFLFEAGTHNHNFIFFAQTPPWIRETATIFRGFADLLQISFFKRDHLWNLCLLWNLAHKSERTLESHYLKVAIFCYLFVNDLGKLFL